MAEALICSAVRMLIGQYGGARLTWPWAAAAPQAKARMATTAT